MACPYEDLTYLGFQKDENDLSISEPCAAGSLKFTVLQFDDINL
jgi:hypothetical protein